MTHKQFVNDIVTAFLKDSVAQPDTHENRPGSGHAFHSCEEKRGQERLTLKPREPWAQGCFSPPWRQEGLRGFNVVDIFSRELA